MFKLDFVVLFVMFLSGFMSFCFLRKHLLITLLSLEYLVLCVFMFLVFFVSDCIGDIYMIMMFLVFSVCEGVLGLSILVSIVRCHGNDQLGMFYMFKW